MKFKKCILEHLYNKIKEINKIILINQEIK